MSNMLRKMKKEMKPKRDIQLNLELAESLIFNRGFSEGARQQREKDVEMLVDILNTLEELHGIGEITAEKIRAMFLERFGK